MFLKKICLMMAVMCTCVAFTACGEKEVETSENVNEQSEQEVNEEELEGFEGTGELEVEVDFSQE